VKDVTEKNCERERGDESADEILNFKGGADGANSEQSAQNGADEISNLHAGAQSARASMDEDASLRNERVNFKADAQKDTSSGLNLSKNVKDACECANQNADEPVQIGRPTGQKRGFFYIRFYLSRCSMAWRHHLTYPLPFSAGKINEATTPAASTTSTTMSEASGEISRPWCIR